MYNHTAKEGTMGIKMTELKFLVQCFCCVTLSHHTLLWISVSSSIKNSRNISVVPQKQPSRGTESLGHPLLKTGQHCFPLWCGVSLSQSLGAKGFWGKTTWKHAWALPRFLPVEHTILKGGWWEELLSFPLRISKRETTASCCLLVPLC